MISVEKLKSTLDFFSAGNKLSKAFRLNVNHDVLRRSNEDRFSMGNPFADNHDYGKPSLPRSHIILHSVAMFFTFIAVCTMAAVAGFQAKWFSVSGGTGFVLFLLLLSLFLTIILTIVPIVYDRWDRLNRPAQFLAQTRSTLILHAFGTLLMLLAAFIVTISAWTEKGCKNPSNDPHSDLGDSYKSGLQNWCKTKKASAIFDWFSSIAWSILLILTILAFRREQKANRRELMVLPPASDGISYSNIQPADEEQLDDKSESARGYTPDVYRKTDTTYHHPASARTVHSPPSVDHHPMLSRTSIDVYGAFDGDGMPRVDEPSRTMQLAYTDPYAQIRQSLMNASNVTQSTHIPGISFGPPAYAGYRQQ
ncbi:hypothetical protein I308_103708 [Cryptococcus tetragattii IND107]|uniref:MARVEL domain-containing protein n=1 Tax=Cryptococcus tetragattii IND107 TaxID=1296105 RepID=A0ABR3BR19_9TREE|nr:hypothetical protein I308_03439 [Cryptococcus tetragattii IND107]